MADKSPAFQWYPKDILTDMKYLMMTWEQRGIFRHLMDLQWIEGFLPDGPGEIAHMISYPDDKFETQIWNKIGHAFPINEDGKRRNPKIEEIRKKQNEYRNKQAKIAKSYHKKRLQDEASHKLATGRNEVDLGSGEPVPARGSALQSSSASASSSAEIKESLKEKPDSFFQLNENEIRRIRLAISESLRHGYLSEANDVAFRELCEKIKKQSKTTKIDSFFKYTLSSAWDLANLRKTEDVKNLIATAIPIVSRETQPTQKGEMR